MRSRDLKGRVSHASRAGFTAALDISAYSLLAMAKRAEPLMQQRGGGSIIAMTYLGSERVVPGYNLMGIAKAALETSVRYLAWHSARRTSPSMGYQQALCARSRRVASATSTPCSIWWIRSRP